MNYPDWAPKTLVELHKLKTEHSRSKKPSLALDPESMLADIIEKSDIPISADNAEHLRRQLYRRSMLFGLPDKEELSLLEKLITDQNMKAAWTALSKRFKDDRKNARQFFSACQFGIAGWRGDPKQTPTERRKFYQDLYDTAGKLESLMSTSGGFDYYSINQLIEDDTLEWMIGALEIPAYPSESEAVEYVRFTLSDVIPSMNDVFRDIANRAMELRDASVTVKKPNSHNADVHYFIRTLSAHCRRAYDQPLNEVVAITTSVVFDLPNCDESYVRKIAKM